MHYVHPSSIKLYLSLPLFRRATSLPGLALCLEFSEIFWPAFAGFAAADLARMSGYNGIGNRLSAMGAFERHKQTIQRGSLSVKGEIGDSNTQLGHYPNSR